MSAYSFELGLLAFVGLPWLSGFMTVAALWNRRFRPGLLVKFFMAPAVGYGLSSAFAYIWFSLFQSVRSDFPLEDVAFHCLIIGVCVLHLLAQPTPNSPSALHNFTRQMSWSWQAQQFIQQLLQSRPWLNLALLALFGLQLMVLAITAINQSLDQPHGGWDAWQTWNYRARVLYRSGNFALNFLPYGHFDYPMLLPLSVIRGWQYVGSETQIVPLLLGLIFLFASIGLLFSAIALFNSIRNAALAGLILLATSRYWHWGVLQYADVPLAYLALCVAVMLYTLRQQPSAWARHSLDTHAHGRAILLGLLLGLCVWLKNEGLFWLLAALGLLIWHNLRQPNETDRDLSTLPVAHVLLGALPVLLVVFSLKFSVSETNDVVAGQSLIVTAQRLLTADRYAAVYYAMLGAVTGYFVWFFAVLVLMSQPRPAEFGNGTATHRATAQARLLTLLILVLLAYALTFIVTPQPLQWHLETSLDRLLLHLWPAFLLAVFL